MRELTDREKRKNLLEAAYDLLMDVDEVPDKEASCYAEALISLAYELRDNEEAERYAKYTYYYVPPEQDDCFKAGQ